MAVDPEADADAKGGAAIRALGPLFRVTEVFLWDDACVGASKVPIRSDSLVEAYNGFDNIGATCSNTYPSMNDSTIIEDLELAQEMCALGFPISFSTSKDKRNMVASGKRKGMKKGKSLSSHKDLQKSYCSMIKEVGTASTQPFHDRTNTSLPCIVKKSLSERSDADADEGLNKAHAHFDAEMISQAAAVEETLQEQTFDTEHDAISTANMTSESIVSISLELEGYVGITPEDVCYGQLCDKQFDSKHEKDKNLETASSWACLTTSKSEFLVVEAAEPCHSDSLESSQQLQVVDYGAEGGFGSSKCSDDLGNWVVVWDTFYMRNYFYNSLTQESTWYPPPGLEHLAFPSKSGEMHTGAVNNDSGLCTASNGTEDKDTCKMLEIRSFIESQDDGKLSIQSCHEVTSGLSHAAGYSVSDVTLFSASDSYTHLAEQVGEVISSEIGKSSDGDLSSTPFHSSDFIDCTESLEGIHNQSHPDEFWMSSSPALVNSETHQLNTQNTYCEPESSVTCLQICYVPGDLPSQCSSINSLSVTFNEVGSAEESGSVTLQTDMTSSTGGPDCHHDFHSVKNKQKVKRIKSRMKKLVVEEKEVKLPEEMEGFSADMVKYWCQRYSLFSKFDSGIKMDEEGWFSVTPELIARHHASRSGNGTVIDCFTGVGGNAIQFAMKNNHVMAIDINSHKLAYSHHNATVYGVRDRIDFVQGDFFDLAAKLKGDVVFMSPPWGGPDYAKVQTYELTMLKPQDGYCLFKIASRIAPKIVMFLPRNVDLNQLAELSLLADPPWELEVEKNYLNGKLKAVTAYFSDTSNGRQDS